MALGTGARYRFTVNLYVTCPFQHMNAQMCLSRKEQRCHIQPFEEAKCVTEMRASKSPRVNNTRVVLSRLDTRVVLSWEEHQKWIFSAFGRQANRDAKFFEVAWKRGLSWKLPSETITELCAMLFVRPCNYRCPLNLQSEAWRNRISRSKQGNPDGRGEKCQNIRYRFVVPILRTVWTSIMVPNLTGILTSPLLNNST